MLCRYTSGSAGALSHTLVHTWSCICVCAPHRVCVSRQSGSTWSEVGNITLASDAKGTLGSISFRSYGYSGQVGPAIQNLPGFQFGTINYGTWFSGCGESGKNRDRESL